MIDLFGEVGVECSYCGAGRLQASSVAMAMRGIFEVFRCVYVWHRH